MVIKARTISLKLIVILSISYLITNQSFKMNCYEKSINPNLNINIWRKGRGSLIKHGHKGWYYFIKVNCNAFKATINFDFKYKI